MAANKNWTQIISNTFYPPNKKKIKRNICSHNDTITMVYYVFMGSDNAEYICSLCSFIFNHDVKILYYNIIYYYLYLSLVIDDGEINIKSRL